jgi:hypothetical protein
MNAHHAFRLLVSLEVLLSVFVLPVSVAVSSPLPADLARYLETLGPPAEGPFAWVLLLLELVAYLGLLFFVRWARELYVIIVAVSLVHTLLDGTVAVLPSGVYVAIQAERLVVGGIIAMAYASPVAPRFRITASKAPSNNQLQRTRDGNAAASPLNSVLDGLVGVRAGETGTNYRGGRRCSNRGVRGQR